MAAARTARPRAAAAAAAASSRRGSQSAGAVSLRRPLYTWGCIPPPERGPFPSSPAWYVRGDCGGRPCPLGGPAPPPAGPLPQPSALGGARAAWSRLWLFSVERWCRRCPRGAASPRVPAGSPPLSRLEPPEQGRLGQASAFFYFLDSIPAGGAGLRSPGEPGAAPGEDDGAGTGGNVNKGLFFFSVTRRV